jgi:hypothetical protein
MANLDLSQPRLEIACSKGDILLALGGYTSLRYLPHDIALSAGDAITLVCEQEPKLRIPIQITSCRNVGNEALNIYECTAAGRMLSKNHQKNHGIYPSDFCSAERLNANDHFTHISFRLYNERDYPQRPHSMQLKQLARIYSEAAHQLAKPLMEAYSYLNIPKKDRAEYAQHRSLDTSVLEAVEFIHGCHKQRQLKHVLDTIKDPGEQMYGRVKTHVKGQGFRPIETQHEIELRRTIDNEINGYSHLRTSVGTAALIAMGAVTRFACRFPPEFSGNSGSNRHKRATIEARKGDHYTNIHASHLFNMPVIVDMEQSDSFFPASISADFAHAHGYESSKAMRSALGVKENDATMLYSYGLRIAYPRERAPDVSKGEALHNETMGEVWRAWKSGGTSVKKAKDFLGDRLAEYEKRIAPASILRDDPSHTIINRSGRPAPTIEARASRLPLTETIDPLSKKPPKSHSRGEARNPHDPGRYRKGGNGWQVR